MREIRATRLSATTVSDVIGGEIVALYAGKAVVRVFMVPASEFWRDAIRAEYEISGRPLRVTRETLTASMVTEIVEQQMDEEKNLKRYGEFIHASKVRAFLLPANDLWEKKVKEKREGRDETHQDAG